MLETVFKLRANRTDIRTELLAGLTTFLTMAYIAFVNPLILADAGMDFGAVFVATCLAAAFGSALMGLLANYPVALAPGMGLNAFFTYGVVLGLGISWQTGLGVVFVAGLIFVLLSTLPVRQWLINGIPITLKHAISVGIGLFLAVIGLKNAAVIVDHPETLIALGELDRAPAMLALLGFFVIAALYRRGIHGAVLIGILLTAGIGIALGVSEWKGVVALPPDPSAVLLQLDIAGALEWSLLAVIITFVFVDLFDTSGTLIGVAQQAGLLDKSGRLPRLGRALLADSGASVASGLFGTSPTTSYIESAAGTQAGGRTGLTACTVALLFLLTLFLAPLAESIPAYATAPALLFVACLMARGFAEFDWQDISEYAPAMITALAMPLSFSIAHGIGLGFVSYAAIKLLSGRMAECPLPVTVIALAFLAKVFLL